MVFFPQLHIITTVKVVNIVIVTLKINKYSSSQKMHKCAVAAGQEGHRGEILYVYFICI